MIDWRLPIAEAFLLYRSSPTRLQNNAVRFPFNIIPSGPRPFDRARSPMRV